MPTVTVNQRINAPREVVFELFSDLEHASQHIPSIKFIEIIGAGVSPNSWKMGKGTRWKETRVMFGKEASETMEITAFDPPKSYTAEAHSCGCHYTTTFNFTPEGDATKVEATFTGVPETTMARIVTAAMGWMMKGMIRKCLNQDIQALKSVAETRADNARLARSESSEVPAGAAGSV